MSQPMELFDSHAHLDFPKLAADRPAVLDRAWRAGVRQIVTIGAGHGVEGNFAAVALAAGEERIWASVGVHPHDAHLGVDCSGDPTAPVAAAVRSEWEAAAERALARLASLALHPRVVAIGEVGLDFHYDRSPRELQRELLRRFIDLAIGLRLPLILHAREAEAEVAAILRERGAERVGGVVHCFSGDETLERIGLELGFCFGMTGILTFPGARDLHAAARRLPLDRLLVETDSPYLAPVPHRGKRNEPAYVAEVARRLATLRDRPDAEVARQTSANARRLFGLDQRRRAERGAIAYRFNDALYLNITNRCSQACRFCLKHGGHELGGWPLGLWTEPDADAVLAAARAALAEQTAPEVVFCGIGEPLLRPDVVVAVGRALRRDGWRVRVNTDGLANLVHGRDVAAELQGAVDAVSVSLNAPDAVSHDRLCPSAHGPAAFTAVCDFIRRCSELFDEVTASAVGGTGVDMAATGRLAESLGASFRQRG